ncbi:MAG: hypothetical protein CMI63_07695 [Parvularcula sp.]|nr:hypothetical protein [Parvularcula sp.]
MTKLAPLKPRWFLSDFEPENCVYVTRADPDAAMWLPQVPCAIDWMACGPRTMLGTLGRFVLPAATTPVGAQLIEWTGLTDETRHVFYTASSDCLGEAEKLSREGAVLTCQHYLPHWPDYDIRWRTPPSLLADLNNKAKLADYVPQDLTPKRRIVARAALLEEIEKEKTPFALKAGTPLSSGGAMAACVCATPDEARATVKTFLDVKDPDASFVIETFYPFTQTWCANIGVYEKGRIYFGAAQQVLDDARKQTGSLNGGAFTAPDAVRDAALAIAEIAFDAGYRGIAGIDMGITEDGKLLAFDLNFRMTACTSQILYHENACARVNAAVSRNCAFNFEAPLAEVVGKLENIVKQGAFVPLSSFDNSLRDEVTAGCRLWGLALGADADETSDIAEKVGSVCS